MYNKNGGLIVINFKLIFIKYFHFIENHIIRLISYFKDIFKG